MPIKTRKMPKVKCPLCAYETDDLDPAAKLNIHAIFHSQQNVPQTKLERRRIDVGVEEEVWNSFLRKFNASKIGSCIDARNEPTQLLSCCSEGLTDLILKCDPNIHSKDIDSIKETIKSFAVIPVAIGVRRAELMLLRQAPDESFRNFAAKVTGKAETCSFRTNVKCNCGAEISVDYTIETVKDVLLAGILDIDIRREALALPNIPKLSVNGVISFVEGREMARNATPVTQTLSALSAYRKGTSNPPSMNNTNKTAHCLDCKEKIQQFKQRANGSFNSKPYLRCIECFRANKRRPEEPPSAVGALSSDDTGTILQISALESVDPSSIMTKNDYKKRHKNGHPRIQINIGMEHGAKQGSVMAVADSGAMSNLWGLESFLNCGFDISDINSVKIDIHAANKTQLNILGFINTKISGTCNDGETIVCTAKVYISDSCNDFYLSYDTMLDLGILGRNFPSIGQFRQEQVAAIMSNNSDETCHCPKRSNVPERPAKLPFSPTEDNAEKMGKWLLDTFKSSTFNTCPHCPLPAMTGPPIEIHVSETATPKACHTAAPVALHWQDQVHKDLLRDEALGVIERVPYGEPVLWCHRMVITRKHDGSPRRTVDLSPLNKFCRRETFSAEAPFPLARRVPGKTWKTVMDAWNGYHSIPLREEDRHLTTFITPFGRWRYTRAPQGYLSSGDGYNRRFDSILSDFERKERCVDDTIFHDTDLEEHWWRAIDFLITCGKAGIVINPKKFQFCKREVDFAGFRITENKIQPLPKYIDAIRAFPTPTNLTDIRSWFGLINRVANYAKLRESMRLFKPFLSPKYKFFWSEVLDKAFKDSKNHIIESILEGVEIFDVSKPTCLRPDWSKKGIGYLLLQKHCQCPSDLPDCCSSGWKITLAGSRFLKGPEERYAAIEGEALAIVWGLEQTKYFTQGCPNLIVITDHKPLTKIFGDRTLDEISNTRLFRLKQKALPWFFRIEHMAGNTNCAADAMSRHPVMSIDGDDEVFDEEGLIVAGICRDITEISTISWEDLVTETAKDETLSNLVKYMEGQVDTPQGIKEFSKYLDYLYVQEGVILYQDRVVMPSTLRQTALNNLHAAHQGVTSMELRASKIMFWPGISEDIRQKRASCVECNINAPSQAPLPSSPATPPSTPFQKVFADYFDFAGHHYLVIGDRLSGWPEIFSAPKGSGLAGSKGLVACLRSFFSIFGVPEELSSDGGPEFSANDTQTFLARWGIHHRKSSAYHPQSNGRAEVAVKSAKRLLRSNIDASGSLNSDKFLRALLQLRNTPDPDCNVSPAQIVFGRPLNDAFSFANRLEIYSNQAINPIWREAWQLKEKALRMRFIRTSEKLNDHAKNLKKLSVGDRCFVQNQTGPAPNKWDRTGIVTDVLPHDKYVVKVDGSGRMTTRNRKFLRSIQPASTTIQPAPSPLSLESDQNTCGPAPVHDFLLPSETDHNTPSPIPIVDYQAEEHESLDQPLPLNNVPLDQNKDTVSNDSIKGFEKTASKVSRASKRLLPFNQEGLKESTETLNLQGRKLRNRIVDI